MLIIVVVVGYIYKEVFFKSRKFRDVNDRVILKLFVVGMILNKVVVVCYVCMFLMIFVVGVFLVDVFDFVVGVFGNVVYCYVILEIKVEVSFGNLMNWVMCNIKIFLDMVV